MKILIVDDEQLARDRLRALIEELSLDKTIAEAGTGQEAIRVALAYKPDLILLDIRMPGVDGMQVAQKLLSLHPTPILIFTTAYADRALEAFECQAADYLLKPIRKNRLEQALKRAYALIHAPATTSGKLLDKPTARSHISVKVRGELCLIPVSKICCFLAEQKYVVLHWAEGQVLLDDTLKNLEKEFAGQFLRIHRQSLVSVTDIISLRKDKNGHSYVQLRGVPQSLEVSRRHLPIVRKILKDMRVFHT